MDIEALIRFGLEHVMLIAAIVMLIVFSVIWSFHFISLVYGKYKFHKKCKRPTESPPPVSILKPLMGVDDNLKDSLESYFNMDYPKYELIFCVQDPNDPSISLVRELMSQYPDVDARLFYGGKAVGINPKINNLVQGYDKVKYELILISDSGVKMAKDTLMDMATMLTDKIGLVHQMPFTNDRPGFAGSLEKVYFGTCHCRMYLFINLLGVNCVTGMSCLMRKSVLDKRGGLKAFSNYIAEDYFIAQAYLDDNWLIQLSHQPAMQNAANYSVPIWQNRMIRWGKLRLRLTPLAWLEPMQECFLLGITSCWTVDYLFGWNSLVFFLIHVLCWFLSDYTLLKITQNGKLPFSKFEYLLCWLYRESITYYLFLKAAVNPTVKWRDGTYRLKWGGLSELVQDKTVRDRVNDVELANLKFTESSNKMANNNNLAINNSETTSEIPNTIPSNTSDNVNHATSTGVNLYRTNSIASNLSNNSIVSNGSKKLSNNHHKRTSSYSIIMKSSNPPNPNAYISDVENSPYVPLLGSSVPQTNGTSATTATSSNNRSQHHHHHSISSPLSSKKYDV